MQASNPKSLQWWQKTIIYQVYPRSFQDSTGNGVGDIPGLTSRLDYFVDIGVETLWISPFYPSPQIDFGYDVSNYCDVDSELFGNLGDFDKLIEEAHHRGLKILVDFVPGHSSHVHPWFQKSLDRIDPFTDYYVWHDGSRDAQGNRIPPNNWLSVFKGTSWAWSEKRQQFYYRPFLPEQPKLNYRCPQLVEEMKNVIRFWFDRGVDGMRLDAINELVEVSDKSLNEPVDPEADCPPDEYEHLIHVYTTLQPETFHTIRSWVDLVEEYTNKDGRPRFMIGETYFPFSERNKYRQCGIVPSNMDFLRLLVPSDLSGESVKRVVDLEYRNLPKDAWPTFVLGNHDNNRIANRFGHAYIDAFNTLLLTLKGTPTSYYGEEIGMADIHVTFEDTQDPFGKNLGPDRYQLYSRDPERSPMQWDNSSNAGFTSSDSPWLPIHPNFAECNVETQLTCRQESTLKLYRILAHLRRDDAFTAGALEYAFTDTDIFSYLRGDVRQSTSRYLVVIHFGKNTWSGGQQLSGHPVNATKGVVKAAGPEVDKEALTVGQSVKLDALVLNPGDYCVIKLEN